MQWFNIGENLSAYGKELCWFPNLVTLIKFMVLYKIHQSFAVDYEVGIGIGTSGYNDLGLVKG